MDGLPALDSCEVVIEVLRSSKNTKTPTNQQQETVRGITNSNPNKRATEMLNNQLSHVDNVTTNALSSQSESQLYIFEDNEAVIKMIITSRNRTMRHVSRTHRVALDWLFDRISFDPKIQIKYVDTKNQLADILTKSSFTRDAWGRLLRFLNIMNFSMFSCNHFLSNRKQSVMSKRAQESTAKESSAGAKPRPMNVVSRNLLSAKKPLHKIRVLRTAWGIKSWIRVMFHLASRY